MKDEIKEILDKLKDSVNYPIIDVPTMDGTDSETMENTVLLEPNESKILLDYITNLQEENKMYSQLEDEYSNIINDAFYKLYDNENNLKREFYNEMLEILLGRNNL